MNPSQIPESQFPRRLARRSEKSKQADYIVINDSGESVEALNMNNILHPQKWPESGEIYSTED
jgi:hypothetical protein